jgi:hypothetical protein
MKLLSPLGICLLLVLFIQVVPLLAQSTQFTYQGSLKSGAMPATGSYDFEFRLFDALSGGTQQGSVIAVNGVAVNEGIFTVPLNFGNQFPGATRFLEIHVRQTGGGALTPLLPRQRIDSSPYSIKTLSAEFAVNASQLNMVPANQYVLTGDTRLSDARNPLPGSGNYIQNQNKDAQPSASFHISGTGSANVFNAETRYSLLGNHILSAPGPNNLFAGNGSRSSNTGSNNSFFGFNAGAVNTSGGSNSFFGTNTGDSNTTGASNSFFGFNAGASNTSAGGNAFFGTSAGEANTGGGNSFFGAFSGQGNTSGQTNTFVGLAAGFLNAGGNDNTFVGANAGRGNVGGGAFSGHDNTFVGSDAGRTNIDGFGNTFVGKDAGHDNVGGQDNSFLGLGAGFNNSDGHFNAFFGVSAGNGNTSGERNAFLGAFAGIATTSGDRNTFVGNQAGNTNTTGNFNTLVGDSANVGSFGLNFATAIGAGAVVTASNTLVLGREADTVQIPGALGQIGIGTNTPEKELHVRGPGDQEIMIESSDAGGRKWTLQSSDGGSTGRFEIIDRTAAASRMIIFNDGDVGIGVTSGTVSLADKLRVNGDIRIGDFSTSFGCVKDNGANVIAGTCSSDLRLKKNITPYSNVLSAFSKLRPVRFDWRADEFKERDLGTNRSFGLIAQEVETAFPDLVVTGKDGMKAVNYSKLPLLTIQAVNELQTRVEGQNTEITALKSRLEEQDAEIAWFRNELKALKRSVQKKATK